MFLPEKQTNVRLDIFFFALDVMHRATDASSIRIITLVRGFGAVVL